MDKLKIEKNVPVPRAKAGRSGNGTTEAISLLKPKDSILLPFYKSSNQASGLVNYAKLKYGWKMTSRTVPGGVRIWRLE